MAEHVESLRADTVAEQAIEQARGEHNALSSDHELFYMYMNALDGVLATPEIRRSFEEFGLSAGILRMKMVHESDQVLKASAREFAAYENAITNELNARDIDSHPMQASRWRRASTLHLLSVVIGVGGALILLGGAVSIEPWPGGEWLLWAGGGMLACAAVLWLSWRALGTDFAKDLLRAVQKSDFGPEVVAAREQLMAAVRGNELLAQVRTFINTGRQNRFGHVYSVTSSPALSEVYDSTNRVSTQIEAELYGLLDRLDGASIGVAGPRGSGKSTLIRQYCEGAGSAADDRKGNPPASRFGSGPPRPSRIDVRCMVAAPVDYAPQEFVLHLFAAFCRTVIDTYSNAERTRVVILRAFWLRRAWSLGVSLLWQAVTYGGYAAVLWYWDQAIARRISVPVAWVRYAAIVLIFLATLGFARSSVPRIRQWLREVRGIRADNKNLVAVARNHLSRVRYLQTYTSGWSGGLSLPGGVGTQVAREVSRTEQPLSYPEIVDGFRDFAGIVAADVHRRGDRLFIGVDELDKIGSAEKAETFLNEVKGIFGIPHLYFIVSVSDDALTAFERRGLPLRDAFDSSFDEILRVGPLTYAESRRLLYRRVIGLTEPYVALCHCLAGGLARDVIRAARQVARNAASLTMANLSLETADIVEGERDVLTANQQVEGDLTHQAPALAAIAAAVVNDELHRKLRAISHAVSRIAPEDAGELQDMLYDMVPYLSTDQAIINVVDLLAKPGNGEPTSATSLRLDFAAYAYYCSTLQEVFTSRLGDESMLKATSTSGPASFDALAAARNAFAIDTQLAWRLISQCRKAWSLETREPSGRHSSTETGGDPAAN